MEFGIYSVFDRKARAFAQPFYSQRDESAVRAFRDEASRPDERNPLYKHPDDYELYRIGRFEDGTGTIVPCAPEWLCSGEIKDLAQATAAKIRENFDRDIEGRN